MSQLYAAVELHAGIGQHFLISIAIFLVQAEGRDAVAQDAAHAGIGVVQNHFCPGFIQPDGGRKTGRARTHDGYAAAGEFLGAALQADGLQVLARNLLLHLVPADGHLFHVEHAVSVAELLPVAHQGGDGRHGVVAEQQLAGLVQAALPVQQHALRDGSVHRTALQSTFGLFTQ